MTPTLKELKDRMDETATKLRWAHEDLHSAEVVHIEAKTAYLKALEQQEKGKSK